MKFYKLLFIALTPALSACGTLDSIFPDRKKEYKETSTIPPLEIPPDLSTSSIEDALPLPNESPSFKTYASSTQAASGEVVEGVVQSESEVAYSELVVGDQGLTYLRLNDRFPSAWRTTGKALSNLTIEIEDRNRSLGIYHIRYAESLTPESEGFFSSMAFWRDEKVAEEQSYQVKLKQGGDSTILQVHDERGQPLSTGAGITLIKELHAQLKSF